jgi:glycoprotein-N-acetylgalactosamine 3-beta-galactosyltransferase
LLKDQLSDIDALDADGSRGYVADPTYIRTMMLCGNNNSHNAISAASLLQRECQVPPGQAEEGPWGIQGIWKIRKALLTATTTDAAHTHVCTQNNNGTSLPLQNSSSSSSPRVLCLVYTHSNRHETVLRSIVETWAPACDGFLAISNQTNVTFGAVHVLHPGAESYKNMWLKIRSAWLYVSKHYLHQYDWFHIGGDDHYLIPQHLKLLASTLPLREPVYMGASMTTQRPIHRFCGGGAGYTMNSAALRLLSLSLTEFQSNLTASAEDRLIGLLFSRSFHNVQCRNTNDHYNEVRYHHLDINFHASLVPGRSVPWNWRALEQLHNISTFQRGLQQISNTSISFHLSAAMIDSASPDRGMRRYHALLFGACGPTVDQQMQDIFNYTHDEIKERIVPGFRKNKYIWAKTKDRCAEAVTSRNQDMEDGYVARKLCAHHFRSSNKTAETAASVS